MDTEYLFAFAYLVCAAVAFSASKAGGTAAAFARPFWTRIAVVSGVFGLLRALSAQTAVSHALSTFNHSEGLQHWERPGPYLMLLAIAAGVAAIAGLLVFRRRASHPSIVLAAAAIVGLVLLALAHSLSLYLPIVLLQAQVGSMTVSRIIETALLIGLAASGLWFVTDVRKAGGGSVHREA